MCMRDVVFDIFSFSCAHIRFASKGFLNDRAWVTGRNEDKDEI
jgi:hypothetical protein